jgi:hypothetical protein
MLSVCGTNPEKPIVLKSCDALDIATREREHSLVIL